MWATANDRTELVHESHWLGLGDYLTRLVLAEREACALLVEKQADLSARVGLQVQAAGLRQLAQEMRARKTP